MEGKLYSRNTECQFVPGWTDFFSGSLQRKPFSIIWAKVSLFKPANEALNPSLEDLARKGLISFTKHQRPISSEDLGQLGLGMLQKVLQIRNSLTPFYTLERKAVDETR